MKSEKTILKVSILTAFSASLCCITPLLALIAGTGSFASSFSWLDPLRPFFVFITLGVLGFAWFQKLKPNQPIDCDCEEEGPIDFLQGKKFLSLVTIIACFLLAFPLFADRFYPENNQSNQLFTDQKNLQMIEFSVDGMTCSGCEQHVDVKVKQLPGIIQINTSYSQSNTVIQFDPNQTEVSEIEKAILSTGYKASLKSTKP
ncbi:mercuric transport protein MerTP [Algoriphagus algorifonticola]|uniref:mercuric transport protein MerTP n=1 Tax=Algoriphagus algorifonticola TaxID=2593007 RepID=UPI0011A69158|nr:mercuric transport protein MerTP [Algoriphagus algorifonticola]